MISHKVVDGKTLDVRLLTLAEKAVQGSGDGRISRDDAENILLVIKADGFYTDVKRETVEFISKNMRWTEAADTWFREHLSGWLKIESQFARMSPEELCKQHFGKEDVLKEESDRQSREIRLRTATMETYQDHDEIALMVRLMDGRRIEVVSNFIELEGELVELRGGFAVPVRAIEKVRV